MLRQKTKQKHSQDLREIYKQHSFYGLSRFFFLKKGAYIDFLIGPSQGDSDSASFPLSSPFWSKLQASAGKPAFPHLSKAHGLYPGLAGPHSSQAPYIHMQESKRLPTTL